MRFLIISCVWVSWMANTHACDLCGCSPSTSLWDQDASKPSSFIQHSIFIKAVKFDDPDNDLAKATFWGQMLTGAWAAHERIELRAILPVISVHNHYQQLNVHQQRWGLGDGLVQVNWQVLNKLPEGDRVAAHSLIAFGGLELPTGNYAFSEDPLLGNIAFGSRSVDFQAGGIYSMTRYLWSVSTGTSLKMNTLNRNDLRMGNQWNSFLQAGYEVSSSPLAWRISAGTRFDYASRNVLREIYQNKTGGWVWQLTAGVNGAKGNWGWGILYQQPIIQYNGNGAFRHMPSILTNIQFRFKNSKS